MKKLIFTLLAIAVTAITVSPALAVDWSQYESGRDNIRLDGYQGQPGYIAFTDGNGTVLGYLWMDVDGRMRYCTKAAVDLTTTKLQDYHGMILDNLD